MQLPTQPQKRRENFQKRLTKDKVWIVIGIKLIVETKLDKLVFQV